MSRPALASALSALLARPGAAATRAYSSAAAEKAKAESIPNHRTVFLRVHPTPTKLADRRAILRMMQRHGEVEMFMKLAGNASFITIMSTTAAAVDLASRSPISFDLVFDKPDTLASLTKTTTSEITAPVAPIPTPKEPGLRLRSELVQGHNGKSAVDPTEAELADDADGGGSTGVEMEDADAVADDDGGADNGAPQTKSFVLHAYLSPDYPHKTKIRQSPLHGPWPSEGAEERSFVSSALRDTVPDAPEAEGLCDWSSGGQLSDEERMLRFQHSSDTHRLNAAARRVTVLSHVRARHERARARAATQTGRAGRTPPPPPRSDVAELPERIVMFRDVALPDPDEVVFADEPDSAEPESPPSDAPEASAEPSPPDTGARTAANVPESEGQGTADAAAGPPNVPPP